MSNTKDINDIVVRVRTAPIGSIVTIEYGCYGSGWSSNSFVVKLDAARLNEER